MIFQDVLQALGASTRTDVEAKLNLIAASGRVGNHVVQGLFTDSRLSSVYVADMLKCLATSPATVPSLKQAFCVVCYRHILKGPKMKGRRAKILGRAIPAGRFRDMLVKSRMFSSTRAVDAFFRALQRLPLAKQRSKLRHLPLGRFVVWATFSSNRSENPFLTLPNDAEEIQDVLGFPVEDRGGDLWLFVYRPSNRVPLLFPTIADAAWNDVFCPAPPGSKVQYGLTRPSRDKPHLVCQPEVVHHDRVMGDTLAERVKYLPALMTAV